jgi:hypothetical protein
MRGNLPASTLTSDQLKEASAMPKVSRDSAAHIEHYGPTEDRHEDLDGYTVNFVSMGGDQDLTSLLAGLPGDSCQCPHWGYVFKGKLTWRFADHEEVFEAGDAFYVPAGHVPSAAAGSELVQFSPALELAEVQAAMMKNMQANRGTPSAG